MTRRSRIVWTIVAAVFTAINLAGAVFAAVAAEPLHAGVHVLLGIAGLYLTWRVAPGRFGGRSSQHGSSVSGDLPPDQLDRLSQIEQSIDAVAIEVERIGEGQRFMTKVLTEPENPQPADGSVDKPGPTPPDARRPQ